MQHPLTCPRCAKQFEAGDQQCLLNKQADGCSSSLREQPHKTNFQHMWQVTDGPPNVKAIPYGAPYLQCFWGSKFDDRTFAIPGYKSLKEFQEAGHAWAKYDASICDLCINSLIDQNLLDQNLLDQNLLDQNLLDQNLLDQNLLDQNLIKSGDI